MSVRIGHALERPCGQALRLAFASARTIDDKYLALDSTVLCWAKTNGYCAENVAKGIKVEGGSKSKRKDARAPFKIEHLQKVFAAPLFTGCKSDRNYTKPGSHRIRDHRYWATLISGMRLNDRTVASRGCCRARRHPVLAGY